MPVDTRVLAHDMRYFVIAYAIAIGAAFLPLEPAWPKWVVAVVLLRDLRLVRQGPLRGRPGASTPDDLAPLRFHRLDRRRRRTMPTVPRLRVVNFQVIAALGLIIVGAFFFVDAVEPSGDDVRRGSTRSCALVIAPIATELPEKFNSVIWVRQGKDTLAMGNITGAMVFQSTIPTVVALLFAADAWHIGAGAGIAFASAGIAFLSVGGDLHPDGPLADALRAAACSSAARSTWSTWASSCSPDGRVLGGSPTPHERPRAAGSRGPAWYTRPTVRRPTGGRGASRRGRLTAQEPLHADPEVEPGRSRGATAERGRRAPPIPTPRPPRASTSTTRSATSRASSSR